ncbi:hypothetical protein JCGZ_02055 [Jatropha curcas]|uniref:Uncharacterized protein n=1 Tax=Jatropha curcas TaxID=180498 RepID=A0A067KV76_JATCU|nr:uncharacterized protein LOC105631864 [Jatropha curcas]KDP40057.1 hypothetical protein JCGZ_02055 [Jatropha curcas]
MGTEILRPQDCLIERIRVSPCRRRNYYYGNSYTNTKTYDSNPRFNRKPVVRSERTDQRKRQPEPPLISKRSNSVGDLKISKNHHQNHGYKSSHNLVMEKVTILRRGESLDSKIQNSENAAALKKDQAGDVVVTGTDRLGPDPGMLAKQLRIADIRSPVTVKCDVYAGSAFAVSPAPSSLPLPSFSKKKQVSFDDSATRDLRRLLRLDF